MALNSEGATTGGFDYTFVGEVYRDYLCPMCQLVLREPHQTNCCGNHVCASCLEGCRASSSNAAVPCPICRQANFKSERDKYVARKVAQLRIRCVHNARGCLWVGELITLKLHVMRCQYVELECPLKCGLRILRRSLPEHQGRTCPKRFYRCEFCLSFQGSYQQVMREHQLSCERVPIPCPNTCSQELRIQRGELSHHLSKCPLQPVDCEFSYAGCNARPQRRLLQIHLEQEQTKHLSLVSTAMVGMMKQLKEREGELVRLSSAFAARGKELLVLRAEMVALRYDANKQGHLRYDCPYHFTVPVRPDLKSEDRVFYSVPFHPASKSVAPDSYRFIVAVYANGIHGGWGSHLSLCVVTLDCAGVLQTIPSFRGEAEVAVLGVNKCAGVRGSQLGTDPDGKWREVYVGSGLAG